MANQTISITADNTGRELHFRIPRPSTLTSKDAVVSPSFWQLVGKSLSVVVLPPSGKLTLSVQDSAIKVLYGRVTLADEKGLTTETRGIAPSAKSIWSTELASRSCLTADSKDGAVFLKLEPIKGEWQGPFKARNQIISKNILPDKSLITQGARTVDLSFIKVEDLAEIPDDRWRGFQFYNAQGFSVYFHDAPSKDPPLVHGQAWALGVGETTRFHNHSTRLFCEINYCMFNGKGAGGMAYFSDKDNAPLDPELELTKPYVEARSKRLVVPSMYEHGPLWKIEHGKKAKPVIRGNNTVDYPWHAWLASEFGDYKIPHQVRLGSSEQSYDIWLSFEFPPSAFQD